MRPPVEILIANYCGREALELCVESAVKRTTWNEGDRIRIYSSPADGSDEDTLRSLTSMPYSQIIYGTVDLNHGQAIWKLINEASSDWVILIDNDCEILSGAWIDAMFAQLTNDQQVGVAKFRSGGVLYPGELITPYYWVACMLLNRAWYMAHDPCENDWLVQSIPFGNYKGEYRFTVEGDYWNVGIDTAGGLTMRMLYTIPGGFNMASLPENFWYSYVKHYGGLSRNHWRPEHPAVAPRWAEVKSRLAELRKC